MKGERWKVRGERWEVKGERWKVKGERWKVRGERWKVRGERWEVKGERWKVRGERWKVKGERWKVRGERWEVKGEGWRMVSVYLLLSAFAVLSGFFFKIILSVQLKSVFLQREILLKSVYFTNEKHLKSVDCHVVERIAAYTVPSTTCWGAPITMSFLVPSFPTSVRSTKRAKSLICLSIMLCSWKKTPVEDESEYIFWDFHPLPSPSSPLAP